MARGPTSRWPRWRCASGSSARRWCGCCGPAASLLTRSWSCCPPPSPPPAPRTSGAKPGRALARPGRSARTRRPARLAGRRPVRRRASGGHRRAQPTRPRRRRPSSTATCWSRPGSLIRAGRTYQSILGEDYTVGTGSVAEALTGTSYAMRDDVNAASRMTRTKEWAQDRLDAISIDAPSGVTLSGTSGDFNIALRNDLDQPVTVEVAATTDSGARVRVANPIRLAPNSRTSVPVDADTTRSGVHNVTLRVVDADGTPLGAEDDLPLRTGQVGVVIWAIIGSGAGILFVAIAIRLVRRFRRRGAAGAEAG
nr:DUF6049 family protein [Nocardioides convexus]